MEEIPIIKISPKPKRNYSELLADSSDLGCWVGEVEYAFETKESKKKKKKSKKKKSKKKLIEEINNYEF